MTPSLTSIRELVPRERQKYLDEECCFYIPNRKIYFLRSVFEGRVDAATSQLLERVGDAVSSRFASEKFQIGRATTGLCIAELLAEAGRMSDPHPMEHVVRTCARILVRKGISPKLLSVEVQGNIEEYYAALDEFLAKEALSKLNQGSRNK